jgi:hypothetical protein
MQPIEGIDTPISTQRHLNAEGNSGVIVPDNRRNPLVTQSLF